MSLTPVRNEFSHMPLQSAPINPNQPQLPPWSSLANMDNHARDCPSCRRSRAVTANHSTVGVVTRRCLPCVWCDAAWGRGGGASNRRPARPPALRPPLLPSALRCWLYREEFTWITPVSPKPTPHLSPLIHTEKFLIAWHLSVDV